MVNLSKTATKFSVSYIKKDKLIFRHKNHQQHTAHEHVHALMTHNSSEIALPQLHGEIQEKSFIGFSRKKAFAIVYNCVVKVKKSKELFSLCHIPTTGCKVTIILLTITYNIQ